MRPQKFRSATVLFTDIVGFTPLASKSTPKEVFEFLDRLYIAFDEVLDDLEGEVCKVETIGMLRGIASLLELFPLLSFYISLFI